MSLLALLFLLAYIERVQTTRERKNEVSKVAGGETSLKVPEFVSQ